MIPSFNKSPYPLIDAIIELGQTCNSDVSDEVNKVAALIEYYEAWRAVTTSQQVEGAMFQRADIAQQRVDRLLGVAEDGGAVQ